MSSRNNQNINSNGVEAFIQLTDTPKSYIGEELLYCQVNNTATGLQFAPASGTGVTQFVQLTDVPPSYAGHANQQVVVNNTSTGLTFIPNGAGVTQFIQLTDTPMTYAGYSPSDIVNINGTTTGLRFTSPADIATNGIALENLSNVSVVPPAPSGYYLTSNGLNQWIATAPNEPPNDPALNILDTNPYFIHLAFNTTTNYNVQTIPSYITLNQGFTVTPPINFSPVLSNPLFSLNWSVNIALHRYGVENVNNTLTIALYTSTLVLVQTLLTQSISNLSIGVGAVPPTPFTFSGLTPNIPLNAGTQYQILISFHNGNTFSFLDVYFNNKNFDFLAGAGEYLERALDYLTFGYSPVGSTLVSNGVNGFNLQVLPNKISNQTDYLNGTPYGTNGQLIQSNGLNGFTLTDPVNKFISLIDCPNNYGIAGQIAQSTGSSVVWVDSSAPATLNTLVYTDNITRAQVVTFSTLFNNYLANTQVTNNVGFTLASLSNFTPTVSGQYFIEYSTQTTQQKNNAEVSGANQFIVQIYNANTFLPLFTLVNQSTNMSDIPQYPSGPLIQNFSKITAVQLSSGITYNTLSIYRNNGTNVNCNVSFVQPFTHMTIIQPDNPDPLSVDNIFERTSGNGTLINNGAKYTINNIVGEPASLFNAYAVHIINFDIVDSVNFANMFLSQPIIFCRMGDMVTMKLYKQGINYSSITTLNNNQSFLMCTSNVPVNVRPTSTQLDTFVFGLNNNWNNTGGIMQVVTSGQLTFRSGTNNLSQFGGFGAAGQTIFLTDQTFTYFINN
jgi:hypothetical protein